MVSYFPTPYPDELLYSILARYHIRSGNKGIKQTIKELFNKTTISAVVDMPNGIDTLISNLPEFFSYDSMSFVMNHTLFPFYTAFLPQKKTNKILNSMKGETAGDIHTRAGIMPSSVHPYKWFRICSKCFKEECLTYGEPYWHRFHNTPGVYICLKHNEWIIDTHIPIHNVNKHEYIPASIIRDNNFHSSNIEFFDKLYSLAEDIKWLIDNYNQVHSREDYKDLYISGLIEKGLATSTGRVYQEEFLSAFIRFYEMGFLSQIQCGIDKNNVDNWLAQIVRKHRKGFHPIRHLILMRFLKGSVSNFFTIKPVNAPFGSGPWPCLNAAANHYKQKTIKEVIVTHCSDTKRPVGTFKCECGFVYSRRGPDEKPDDIFKIGRIKTFGPVWREKLKYIVECKGAGLRETARELNVDPGTVKKYSDKYQFQASWNQGNKNKNIQSASKSDEKKDLKGQHRSEWTNLIVRNPNVTKTQLRQLNKSLYMWLYRNDSEWLNNNSPPKVIKSSSNRRVDWELRDDETLKIVKEAIQHLLSYTGKPIKITISRIGKITGLLALLEKHLDKMPKTKDYILSMAESIEDYQIRRVEWAAREITREGYEIAAWRIERKAGLKARYSKKARYSNKVLNAIRKEIIKQVL